MATNKPPLPDPDEWMQAQRTKAPAALPDPDEWMASQQPAPQPAPVAAAPAPPAEPEYTGLDRIPLVRALKYGAGQAWDAARTPLLPATKLTKPMMETAPQVPIGGLPFMPTYRQATAVIHGAAGTVEDLSKPTSLAMMAATAPLLGPSVLARFAPHAAKTLAAMDQGFLPFLNATGLTADMGRNAFLRFKEAKRLWSEGKHDEAIAEFTAAAGDAAMAGTVGKHTVGKLREGTAFGPTGVSGESVDLGNRLRQGIHSPYIDEASLHIIRDRAQQLPDQLRGEIENLVDRKLYELAPKPTSLPAKPEPPKPGTIAQGPFPGPQETVRAQMNVPAQKPMVLPEEPLPPTQPRPTLTQQVKASATPLPARGWVEPKFEQHLPIYTPPPEMGPVQVPPYKPVLPKTPPAAPVPPKTAPVLPQVERSQLPPTPTTPPVEPVPTPEVKGIQEALTPPPAAPPPAAEAQRTIIERGGFGQKKPRKYDPAKSIINAIKHFGGLDPDNIRKSGLEGEWKQIDPIVRMQVAKRGSGIKFEEMSTMLREAGYDVPDDKAILDILRDPKRYKQGLNAPTEKVELAQAEAEIERLRAELESLKAGTEGGWEPGEEGWKGEGGFALMRDFPKNREERGLYLSRRINKLIQRGYEMEPGETRDRVLREAGRLDDQMRSIAGLPQLNKNKLVPSLREEIRNIDKEVITKAGTYTDHATHERMMDLAEKRDRLQTQVDVLEQKKSQRLGQGVVRPKFGGEEGFARMRDDKQKKLPYKNWDVAVKFRFPAAGESGSEPIRVSARTKQDAIRYARDELSNRGYDRHSGPVSLTATEAEETTLFEKKGLFGDEGFARTRDEQPSLFGEKKEEEPFRLTAPVARPSLKEDMAKPKGPEQKSLLEAGPLFERAQERPSDQARAKFGLEPQKTITLFRGMDAADYAEFQKTGLIPRSGAARATTDRAEAEFYANRRGGKVVEFKVNSDDVFQGSEDKGKGYFRLNKELKVDPKTGVASPSGRVGEESIQPERRPPLAQQVKDTEQRLPFGFKPESEKPEIGVHSLNRKAREAQLEIPRQKEIPEERTAPRKSAVERENELSRLIEEKPYQKPASVESLANNVAQAEVDRRAQFVRDTVERVVNGKGTWSQKRKQLGLENMGINARGRYPDIPIAKSEIERVIENEMRDTITQTGLSPTAQPQPKPTFGGEFKPSKGKTLFGDEEGFALQYEPPRKPQAEERKSLKTDLRAYRGDRETAEQWRRDLPKRNEPAKSKFGDDAGWIRFREKAEPDFIENDPELKRIFRRIDESQANYRRRNWNPLTRRGEADVPGQEQRPISWIRSSDLALERSPETAPVARGIKGAARTKKQAMQHYDDIANDIIKEGKIKKGSPEDEMVRDLLDQAYTGLTPEGLRKSTIYTGDKEAAIKAAGRLRSEIFEPIINQIRSDPELVKIIGTKGYIRGYFPHFAKFMQDKYGKYAPEMMRAVLPEKFVSKFLKERESDTWAQGVSVYDVVPSYIHSTMKTIHDIPAYDKALKVIEALPEGPHKEFAGWYAKNYMGTATPWFANWDAYHKLSRWVAGRYYDNLIGGNVGTWAVNLGQTLTNTYPELGAKYTKAGIKALMSPEGRKAFHESGLLFDYPGIESGILSEGLKRKVLHGGMAGGEYLNRGIAFLGGLEQAKDMGLVGRAAENHAMDIVDKTQFAYGKESSMRILENLPPDLRVFQTFPLKEAEFARNLISDAVHGGKIERAKLGRFLMINFAVPAALTAAGVPVGRMFVEITDMIPGVPRTARLAMRLSDYYRRVQDGKIKVEDIPKDVVLGLYDAFGPAANALKKLGKATGVIPEKKKAAAR